MWDAARALDEAAGSGWDNGSTNYEFAAAVAATLAPVAAQHCAQDCIQVHGGIGFTWEHDTNIYYRRTLALVAAFGRSTEYPQRVFDTATTTGMRAVKIDLDPATEKMRAEIRAEVDALKANSAGAARRRHRRGRVQPHLPLPWGRAATPIEQIIMAQEFSAGRVKRPNMGIAAWLIPSIVTYGTEEQKQRFLPPTFRGELIWCQLFSEPGAGSDLASLTTKATKVDGGWRITGQKIWTTAAQFSRWGALLARTDPSAPKHNGITYFLLDMKSEGVEVKPPARTDRQRVVQHRVHRRRLRAGRDGARPGEPRLEVSRNTLTAERVSIGSDEPGFPAEPDPVRRVRQRGPLRSGGPPPGRLSSSPRATPPNC